VINLPATLWPWMSTQLLIDKYQGYLLGGKGSCA